MRRALPLLLLWAAPALAQAYLPFKMFHDASNPFFYWTDTRNNTPVGLSLSLVQSEINTSWNSWNAVSCSSVRAANQGGSSGVIANPEDPFDVYSVSGVWVTSAGDPMYGSLFGSVDTISISVPTSYAGVLKTCDAFFNGVDYAWSVSATTPVNAVDVQSAMVHEAGHCMGLDHYGLNDPTVVMNPFVPVGGQRRALTALDVTAICDDYPAMNGVGSPCSGDGGCGAATSLRCATQTIGGVTSSFCTNGCAVNTGAVCDLPLVCTGSTLFNPTYNGACLRPDNTVTLVGAPCGTNGDCGSSLGLCWPQGMTPSGQPQWVGGYCYQTCAGGQTPCPANSACTDVGLAQPVCLENCRVGFADCRQGYSCALTVNGGVCIPSCYADVDCGDPSQYLCRVCDGLCVGKQNPTGQVGDQCLDDSTCGPGQNCANLDSTHVEKQCTIGCSRGCASCPNGSSCHPLPTTGELLCLRDCTGAGTCPTGTQCLALPTGHACMPACLTTAECPVGTECFNGECVPPGVDDGGCGAFCQMQDAGKPVPKKDGGAGGGQDNTGGCGCQSGGAGEFALSGCLWLALLALARARPARERVRVRRRD